ncbi:MAG: hypothetical protein ACKO9Z_02050 [Planctomycetota bacterium]
MTALICPRCQSANPEQARYCHHDGILLDGVREAQKARAAFPSPFVFKSGLSCPDFKTLGRGILAEWDDSREMLAFADWEGFFSGIGRQDLAQVAAQARLFPDPDRGLDQLVCALPGLEITPGKLASPTEVVDFGTLSIGQNSSTTITLENQGDRLVWGEAFLKDTPWCSLSPEGPLSDRSFRFIRSMSLGIHVSGESIRRSGRQLTGSLLVKTESSEFTIQLIAREPDVIPFDGNIFHGAVSPRNIAEKAIKKPREAAPLFHSGAVAKWYESNGWSYPVTGPTAPGMASVQQFFEAHGFAPAPKVDVEPGSILIKVAPGEPATKTITLKTAEKRHVFGYVVSSEPWVSSSSLVPNYQTATIDITFDTSSATEESPLRTVLTILANGQQRFDIPVEIQATPNIPALDLDALAVPEEGLEFEPVELLEGEFFGAETDLQEATLVASPVAEAVAPKSPSHSPMAPVSTPIIPVEPAQTSPQVVAIPFPSAVPAISPQPYQPAINPISFTPQQTNPVPANLFSPPSQPIPAPPQPVTPPASIPIVQESDPFAGPIAKSPTQTVSQNTPVISPPTSTPTDAGMPVTGSLTKPKKQPLKISKKTLTYGALGVGGVLVLILGIMMFLQGGGKTAAKELVRPVLAGNPTKDLLSFTVETLDQDRISILATEGSDAGSNFMLKSGNFTATPVSKKSLAKTVIKWENKDGWAHREVDMSMGGNKWRVAQWLKTLSDEPDKCAVLFEISPLDRDSKITARLALRPGTGTGSGVSVADDAGVTVKKPILYKGEKLIPSLSLNIDSPPITGTVGLDVKEILLPGREKAASPAKASMVLIGQGADAFIPWDCQFPELFDDMPDSPPPAPTKVGKAPPPPSGLKDPFVVLYWDESTVRKGQKRLIGFTLGLTGKDGGSK